ncbi:hypothetical protein L596_004550 [Steinernema carpocapsae]|uniref:Uncharacterized protein n=1 Tax=Steinernema carpocapsae TaxID=34508 RepID=A0A4V6I8D4_STECR|nr:hypothetical protein L596_004550 [Steinernema carpocapsae]
MSKFKEEIKEEVLFRKSQFGWRWKECSVRLDLKDQTFNYTTHHLIGTENDPQSPECAKVSLYVAVCTEARLTRCQKRCERIWWDAAWGSRTSHHDANSLRAFSESLTEILRFCVFFCLARSPFSV